MPEQPAFRVLIVDDVRDVADSECTLLRMSGYECRSAYEIHAALALASPVTLIAVTGRTDQQDRAAQAGFDHYLIKPVDPDELKDLLEAIRQQF